MRDKLSQAIPITLDHRKKIEQLNRELIGMRGYYNVIKAIPASHIQSRAADSYTSRFNDIIDTVTLTGNPFYENYNQVNTMLGRAKTLSKELKELGDRYVFYRKLVYAQAIEKRGWLPNDNSYSGCVEFPISEAVTSDINAGIWSTEKRTVKIGDGYKTWAPSMMPEATERSATSEYGATHQNIGTMTMKNGNAHGRLLWEDNRQGLSSPVILTDKGLGKLSAEVCGSTALFIRSEVSSAQKTNVTHKTSHRDRVIFQPGLVFACILI